MTHNACKIASERPGLVYSYAFLCLLHTTAAMKLLIISARTIHTQSHLV